MSPAQSRLNQSCALAGTALQWGVTSSYARAFRKDFGISPGRYRRDSSPLAITPRLDLSRALAAGSEGMLFPPRVVFKLATTILGQRHRIVLADLPEADTVVRVAKAFHDRYVPVLANHIHGGRYIGMVEYSGDPAYNWYVAGFELHSGGPLSAPADLEVIRLPPRHYADFLHLARHHPENMSWNDLKGLYASIFGTWVPCCPQADTSRFHLEYVDLSRARDDYGEFRILIPLNESA